MQTYDPPHPSIAEKHNDIGNVCGTIRGAAFHHGYALQMFEEVYGASTPHHNTARAHAGLGAAYVEMGDLDGAIHHMEKALDMYLKLHAHADICTAYRNLRITRDRHLACRYIGQIPKT